MSEIETANGEYKFNLCFLEETTFSTLLRSRGTRERILIWFHRREKSRFVDCKLAAPVGFCRGFGLRFRVHLSRHACSLSLFSTFWGFL